MDGSRALQGAPGVLGGVFLEALEVSRGAFWIIFLGLGGTGRENGEMLESDDLLNENAMFRGSQGPQNETKMAPEEQRRENRSTLAGWLVGWLVGWMAGRLDVPQHFLCLQEGARNGGPRAHNRELRAKSKEPTPPPET